MIMMTSSAVAVDWQLLPKSANQIEWKQELGELSIQSTGRDPFLVGRLSDELSTADRILEFEYFSTTGVSDFSIILGPPISEAGRVTLPPISIAEGWQRYTVDLGERVQAHNKMFSGKRLLRFDWGTKTDTRIKIRKIRVRERTDDEIRLAEQSEERRAAKLLRAKRIRDSLSNQIVGPIQGIVLEKDTITIAIKPSHKGDELFLVGQTPDSALQEFRPYHHRFDKPQRLQPDKVRIADDGNKLLSIPRFDGVYDRALSAWGIEHNGNAIGTRRYLKADEIASKLNANTTPIRPRNKKGLSGLSRRGPQQDFVDLGISSVTVNMAITRFITNRPGTNRVPVSVGGDVVYFNPDPFAHYDQILRFTQKHDIVVSAIVLIPSPKNGWRSPLVHPETDGGTYAMPDLTSATGAKVYSLVLNEIAKRYSGKTESPGSISNWIAHNEIDFHTVWTNMGRQPRELVTETYYRSMRLIHNIAKQHNPDSRVFASLTHHWNVPDDGRWQQLSPKQFLLDVQRFCQLEGDFDWGVAYHPYPQSLFAKVAWEDKKISDDFDSPLITMQNLEVLGRFLEQPSMRAADGSMRPVILSEQGFHTDSYDQDAQRHQAASLYWAMKRVQEMPWVESFIYHRWIDHPGEGGLMLGLRTLPTKQNPHGKKKRSWQVYKAIGTDEEKTAAVGLPLPASKE